MNNEANFEERFKIFRNASRDFISVLNKAAPYNDKEWHGQRLTKVEQSEYMRILDELGVAIAERRAALEAVQDARD